MAYIAPRRLYLTRDGRVVGDGDPDAWTLLSARGREVPEPDVVRYRLRELDAPPTVAAPDPEPDPDPDPEAAPEAVAEVKQVDGPPEDKARRRPAAKRAAPVRRRPPRRAT